MPDNFENDSLAQLNADEAALLNEMPTLNGVGQSRRSFMMASAAGGLSVFASDLLAKEAALADLPLAADAAMARGSRVHQYFMALAVDAQGNLAADRGGCGIGRSRGWWLDLRAGRGRQGGGSSGKRTRDKEVAPALIDICGIVHELTFFEYRHPPGDRGVRKVAKCKIDVTLHSTVYCCCSFA